jgi:hypothetical protein
MDKKNSNNINIFKVSMFYLNLIPFEPLNKRTLKMNGPAAYVLAIVSNNII